MTKAVGAITTLSRRASRSSVGFDRSMNLMTATVGIIAAAERKAVENARMRRMVPLVLSMLASLSAIGSDDDH